MVRMSVLVWGCVRVDVGLGMCLRVCWFGVVSVCVDVGWGYVRVGHTFLVAYTFTHTHG